MNDPLGGLVLQIDPPKNEKKNGLTKKIRKIVCESHKMGATKNTQ